jgi:hypothetical protein
LKKRFKLFKDIGKQSGFGFNAQEKTYTAGDAVWNAYIAAKPDAEEFRWKALEFYDELSFIYEGKIATGNFTFSSVPIAGLSTPPTFNNNINNNNTNNNNIINNLSQKMFLMF